MSKILLRKNNISAPIVNYSHSRTITKDLKEILLWWYLQAQDTTLSIHSMIRWWKEIEIRDLEILWWDLTNLEDP